MIIYQIDNELCDDSVCGVEGGKSKCQGLCPSDAIDNTDGDYSVTDRCPINGNNECGLCKRFCPLNALYEV